MTIEIKHRHSGKVLLEVEAKSLWEADLRLSNLEGPETVSWIDWGKTNE